MISNEKPRQRTNFVPDAYFYDFCTSNLPSAKDFWITDIDLFIRDRNNNFMFIEKKCKNGLPTRCQEISYHWLHAFVLNSNGRSLELPTHNVNNWQYYGYHLLQLEGTTFEDGKIFFDNIEITKTELIDIMSFRSNKINILAKN